MSDKLLYYLKLINDFASYTKHCIKGAGAEIFVVHFASSILSLTVILSADKDIFPNFCFSYSRLYLSQNNFLLYIYLDVCSM